MAAPVALLFPGQGAQSVGMGLALAGRYAAVETWLRRAEEAAGFALLQLLREGPEEQLQQTEFLQPALVAVEYGAWLALRETVEVQVVAAAGHSVGEYAALAAAGSIDPAAAVATVRRRGQYMQQAVPLGVGGMAAVLGIEAEPIAAACAQASQEDSQVWVSNDNAPGQVVISGHLAAIERATPLLKDAGARRVMPLKVSAPFHCPLMKPAAERLAADLALLAFHPPVFPVLANHSATAYTDGENVRAGLINQVVNQVQFTSSLRAIGALHPRAVIEVGPGTVASGLAKRTIPDMLILQAGNPDQIDEILKGLA